jgi:hypothetical protein
MENNKAVEAGSNSAGGATGGQTMNGNGGANPDPSTIPNPKLGMAPLSSELAVAAASNNVPAETQQPSNQPLSDPFQSTGPPNTRNSVPPTVDSSRPDPVVTDPTQLPTISTIPQPEQAPQADNTSSSPADTTAPPPDPAPMVDPVEQSHLPDPNLNLPDPPPTDPPVHVDTHPPNVDNTPKEMD